MFKHKNLYMANFNCTFGENHLPMLEYFEEIVLPAFTNGYKKKTSKSTFFFHNVNLIEYKKDKYAISGIIVKQTILEVKSLMDDKTGDIIRKDEKIPSDPFSYFTIFLENHRMVLVKNQSGSPNLKNFESMVKFALKEASEDYFINSKKISITLNVGSFPSIDKIDEQLSKVVTISEVVLKLYPLNGDIDDVYGGLRYELKELGCKEGFTTFKNPNNIDKVKENLKKGNGIFKPIIRGKGLRGEKIKITDEDVSSVVPVLINEDEGIKENTNLILEQVEYVEDLKVLSEENKNKYMEKLTKIKDIFNSFK